MEIQHYICKIETTQISDVAILREAIVLQPCSQVLNQLKTLKDLNNLTRKLPHLEYEIKFCDSERLKNTSA